MRWLASIPVFVAAGALAQEPQGADCNIVTGIVDINENGELARPEPTPEQCAAVEVMLQELLATERREFRRVVSRDTIPGNVYTSISRFGTFGGPWNPDGLPRSDRPDERHSVSWLTDRLVVIVSEASDFSGPTTTVVIVDLENLQVCSYPNWPVDRDPLATSIGDIQELLGSGIRRNREQPVCHLKPLVID